MSKGTQHTPGPWQIRKRAGALGHEVYCPFPSETEYERSRTVIASIVDTEANARLIAAAPELLEALEGMIRAFETEYGLVTSEGKALQKARAAIKRAKGQ